MKTFIRHTWFLFLLWWWEPLRAVDRRSRIKKLRAAERRRTLAAEMEASLQHSRAQAYENEIIQYNEWLARQADDVIHLKEQLALYLNR